MPHQTLTPNRAKALLVLKELLCRLYSVHADLLYISLLDEGFSEQDAGLLVGPCFRTAAMRGWMKKTPACLPSRRNHSNLMRVWISCLHDPYSRSGAMAAREIRMAYARWEAKKMAPPDDLANTWKDR